MKSLCVLAVVVFRLLRENAPLAKQELHNHLLGVQMYPAEDGDGVCYIAKGTWDLLGVGPIAPKGWVPEMGRFELVAGGGFVPQCTIHST